MPLFHIGGSGWADVALARGGTDVLVPMIDPAALLDTIERAGITNAFLVPAVLQMMCAVPGRRRPRLLQPALDRVRRLADHRPRR